MVDKRTSEKHIGDKKFDPFQLRLTMEHGTTDRQVLVHLLKATIGPGILYMPFAYKFAGLILGIFLTLFTGFLCGHCAHVLIASAHKLYYKEQKTKMTYGEVIETTFRTGPIFIRKLAWATKTLVSFGLFLTYFGTCCVYAVFVAKNLDYVIESLASEEYNNRHVIASLTGPFLLLTWIPNYKKLAPLSTLANYLMDSAFIIIVYYTFTDLTKFPGGKYVCFSHLPEFFSITIYNLQSIGVMLPLENTMKTPKHFLGVSGVLSRAMIIATILSALIGFLGYLHYGYKTDESITLNLPADEWPARTSDVLAALAVFVSFGIQFTVCLEIIWEGIKGKFTKKAVFANYVLRTVLTLSAIGVAIAVPTIGPLVELIGALFISFCGLLIPVIIEIILCSETGFGTCLWILWKDIAIICFGILAMTSGTLFSLENLYKFYE